MPITRGLTRTTRGFARAFTGVLSLLFCALALATPPLSVQRYSLEEGLSQQAVNAIVQDADGFMWFGTEDGLNRFDGYEFRQLRHDRGDTTTLPNGWISSLVASEDGLWIGTDGGGVVFRSALTGNLASPVRLREASDLQRVRALSRDRLGRIWVASCDAGVAIFDSRTDELHRVRHTPTETNSLSDNSIFSIAHLRNGDTLIARPRSPQCRDPRSVADRAAHGAGRAGATTARARAHRDSRRHGLGGHRCRPGPVRSARRSLAHL
jgi:ligand-binding sensor domain-containing protein